MDKLRVLTITLEEEYAYKESIFKHIKGIESTIWGLEEQSKQPENSSPDNQKELSEKINSCRIKVIRCEELLKAQEKKIKDVIMKYLDGDCHACSL